MTTKVTPPIDKSAADKVIGHLEGRLVALIDLQLTLKHVHWNVTGPNFIAVHEMLDPHAKGVRDMTDAVAERIATLGGVPVGTPGHVVNARTWDEYDIGRDSVQTHLKALDKVYAGVIDDHRTALEDIEEYDPITHDLLVSQVAALELTQWFIRSHLA